MYRCSDCGVAGASTGPESFCWCGFHFKGQEHLAGTYICVPFSIVKEMPDIANLIRIEFGKSGCDVTSKKAQVGVMTRAGYAGIIRSRG